MNYAVSLVTLFWDPFGTFRKVRGWFLPYVATTATLAALGLFTQATLIPFALQRLDGLPIGREGADMLQTGAYIGVVVSAILFPLIIPWCLAFISKLVSLFIGVRTTFAEYFKLYEWGFYGATLPVVLIKLVLMWFLPVDQWHRITLSLAALLPENTGVLYQFTLACDLSTMLLVFFTWIGLRSTAGKNNSVVALCTGLVLTAVQLAAVL